MSAQSDLFGGQAPPAGEIVVDLRQREAWAVMRAQGTDERLDNVIISYCGRFTVVRFPPTDVDGEHFMAFRRFGKPEFERWSPPAVLGKYHTGDEARDRCARFVETGS